MHTARRTVTFIVVLCLVAALILAILATSLRPLQTKAKQLDLAKQILLAAQIYSPKGNFLLTQEGQQVPARYDPQKGMLVVAESITHADEKAIYAIFQARIKPYLTNTQGEVTTFIEAKIPEEEYIQENQVAGYASLPDKLFYVILPNYSTRENPAGEGLLPEGYILPVAGFGLWGPIFGYLALEANADSIIGASWTAPLETPGLGSIIQEPDWLSQFRGKEIFLPSSEGETDFEKSALGITVVKGKVADVYGEMPRAVTAVDGVTGATLTGDGVTKAYTDSLGPYRPLLVEAHEAYLQGERLKGIAYGY